jgi:hypothetical protein
MSLAVLSVALCACVNPLPFGPGRISLVLIGASVERVSSTILFGTSRVAPPPVTEHETLHLRFSSSIDLYDYFASWERSIQVRCHVDGSANGYTYTDFGRGPYEAGINISELRRQRGDSAPPPSGSSGEHEYSVFAFPDLTASDEIFERGQPRSYIHLDTDGWSTLSCYVIGVIKAPALFPRSNDLLVNADQFHALLRASRSQ